MNTSKLINWICFISILLISCNDKKTKESGQTGRPDMQPAMNVNVMVVSADVLSADIEVPGTILPNESTLIYSEVTGRLVQLNIREGAIVSKGALLAKLFDGDLQAQKRKLQVQLKIAEQTENRQAQLLKIQGISQQEYDLSLLQVHNLNADIDIINEAIRKTEIRAPFSGKLGFRNVSPGAFITPSVALTTISQVNQLKIQFNIPEKYGSLLKMGQTVSFTIDGSNKIYTASVIAAESGIAENTRSLAIRAQVKNADQGLLPGAFAKVKVVLEKNEQAMMIPNNIIIPQGRNKIVYLYKGGKSIQTNITTGVRDSTRVEVLEGLQIGDTVITSGLLFLKPGADVKLIGKN